MNRFLKHYALVIITMGMGLAPLVVALISQYAFGKYPCHLCVLQRYPYVVVMVLALAMGFVRNSEKTLRMLLALMVLVLVVNAGIAAYHVGVEQKWITGPEGCTTGAGGAELSLEELRAQILGTAVVMCDNPTAIFMGISMAGWNVLYALSAAVASGVLLRRRMRAEVVV